jgi:hypothetical protein
MREAALANVLAITIEIVLIRTSTSFSRGLQRRLIASALQVVHSMLKNVLTGAYEFETEPGPIS